MKFDLPFVSPRRFARTVSAFSILLTVGVFAGGALAPAPASALATFGGTGRNSFEPSTNPLTAEFANRGWQYTGLWGDAVGTVIAPNYFVSAEHLPGDIHDVGATFTFDGASYLTTAGFVIPGTDLHVFRVDGTFPRYAQLYTGGDEVGKELFTVGRGPGRGAPNGDHGWYDGGYPEGEFRTLNWGTNAVTSFVTPPGGGPGSEYMYYTFDQGQGPHEATGLSGDSGAGVFMEENGVWKLGGTLYAVDGFFSNVPNPTQAERFLGAFYDTRGMYAEQTDGSFALVTGDAPVPSGSYSTRISANIAAIDAITGLNSYAAVPEPSSLALLAPVGIRAFTVMRRRRRNNL